MEPPHFKIRSYSWQELAILYGPELTKESATKRLAQWVRRNVRLHEGLINAGWMKGTRVLTPVQVEIIVHYLGEP